MFPVTYSLPSGYSGKPYNERSSAFDGMGSDGIGWNRVGRSIKSVLYFFSFKDILNTIFIYVLAKSATLVGGGGG